jgi:hypothetical protein
MTSNFYGNHCIAAKCPRRFEWGYETGTALSPMLRPDDPQVVAADCLFQLPQLSEL